MINFEILLNSILYCIFNNKDCNDSKTFKLLKNSNLVFKK
jgi:hypothetical protein